MAKKAKSGLLFATASAKRGYVFSYRRPVGKNDLKREGKTLQIGLASNPISSSRIVLDGHGIRMLKNILRNCGEIGGKVNRSRTKVLKTQHHTPYVQTVGRMVQMSGRMTRSGKVTC